MLTHSPRRARSWSLVVGFLAVGLLTWVTGCGGPNYKARATVKGKVTLGKRPLTAGTVMFYNTNGITSSASIDPQGNYVMNDAPIGDVTITVNVPPMPMDPTVRARMKGMDKMKDVESKNPEGGPGISLMPEMPKEIVPIPDKYAKPETSGLTYKVEKGEHTHNIEL